jgi:NUMOD4 motif/HNH endonuclease/AP2 domain
MENWKIIQGFEKYQVSDQGHVRRIRGRRFLKTNPDNLGYPRVNLMKNLASDGKKTRRVHILVAKAFIVNPDDLPEVDHIDKNKTNNLVSNLRWCNRTQNEDNKGKKHGNHSSRFIGVCRDGDKWRAQIYNNGKELYIGVFATGEEAAIAYDKKAIELRGEFASTNFLY